MTPWTDEMVQSLRKHHRDGLSAGQIARELFTQHRVPFSRNAVIGKLSRLGLTAGRRSKRPAGGKPAAKTASKRAARPKPPLAPIPKAKPNTGGLAAVNAHRRVERLAKSPKGKGLKKVRSPVALPMIAPTRHADLKRGQCTWCVDPVMSPAGPDMLCCGAPVMDRHAVEGKREATHCQHHFEIGASGRAGIAVLQH